MKIDNVFYQNEYGTAMDFLTGIDMTGLPDSDVKSVFRKPSGTVVLTSVPAGDRTDIPNGRCNVIIPQGAFDEVGDYELQVAVKTTTGITPSRKVEFQVVAAAEDLSSITW